MADTAVGFSTHFASYLPLEFDARMLIDEAEILQDFDALLIVWQQLQVLVRHELPQLRDVFFDEPFIMAH